MRRRGAVTALVVLSLLLPAGEAGAATRRHPGNGSSVSASKAQKAGVDASIQALNGRLDEVDANAAALQTRLDAANLRQDRLTAQLSVLDQRLSTVQASLAGAQASLDRASSALVSTRLALARVRSEQAEARRRLRADAVAAYISQPAAGLTAAVVDLRSVDQLQAELGYLSAVASAHSEDVARFQLLKTRTLQLQDRQQAAQESALRQRDAVAAQRSRLAGARQAVADARSAQAAQAAELAGLHAQLAAEKASLQSQLAALQEQSDRIAALIRAEEASAGTTTYTGGQLGVPIPGAPVTSPFGYRVDPVLHESMLHSGIDFGAGYGTPIHAAADGVVVAAGPEGGYGNATVIDHGGSVATLYGHQEQILVGVGERVSRGEVIGLVGCTGWCTGPHVHFEVRISGRPVDPAPYLGMG